MIREKLIILSDLFGKEKSDWISVYYELLSDKYDIHYIDSKDLGEITLNTNNKEDIHNLFIAKSITVAVNNLTTKYREKINILAFSIGGTIAWKAILKGLNVSNFWAVSSTRIRYETKSPKCKTTLFYGENDTHKPDDNCFTKLKITPVFLKNQDHNMYSNPKVINTICNNILKQND
ncbi:hypothetical protein GCM10022291_24120 [Postechiella marina]|uniref:Alpha/beta hydrolase n=1 Tax=Postechiella marina TaxID=943941 RepID=A0ABP8CCG5_9FLAO